LKKKKVLFIIPSVDSGGIETYVLRFLRKYKSQIQASVLVRHTKKGDLFEQYNALEIPLYFIPLGKFNVKKWKVYRSLFEKEQFDTVCDFNANFAGIPMWMAKKAGVPNRIAFYRQGKDHFNTKDFSKRMYNNWVKSLVNKHATKILANSKAGLDFFYPKREKDARFKVIYNGIDFKDITKTKSELKKEFSIPDNTFVIGHVGRLDKAKNHETILKVLAQLAALEIDFIWLSCGRNTENLLPQIKALHLEEKVRLLGFRKDVHEITLLFDLFYFPSNTEGQPNALIEAMQIGVPIISSSIEPIKETTPAFLSNYLFEPNEVDNVVDIIHQIIKHQIEYPIQEMKEWSRAQFSSSLRFKEFFDLL